MDAVSVGLRNQSYLKCIWYKQSWQSMEICSQVWSVEQPSCIERQLFFIDKKLVDMHQHRRQNESRFALPSLSLFLSMTSTSFDYQYVLALFILLNSSLHCSVGPHSGPHAHVVPFSIVAFPLRRSACADMGKQSSLSLQRQGLFRIQAY